jgi:anti-anti-sigma factor
MTADENAPKPQPEPGAVELTINASGVAVVSLRGECDLTTRDALGAALTRASDQPGQVVLVDLSECSFIDSTVIGAIALTHKALGEQDRRLELVIPPERRTIRRIVEMSGLAPFFTIHEAAPAP